MPARVDRTIRRIMESGKSESQAIAIAKSRGLIKQSGRKLKPGPKSRRKAKGKKS